MMALFSLKAVLMGRPLYKVMTLATLEMIGPWLVEIS